MNQVRKYLKPFISNYTSVLRSTRSLSVYQAPINFVLFSPIEILNLAVDALYRLPPSLAVHADHGKLPNTVLVIDLLKCLQKTLNQKDIAAKLPQVEVPVAPGTLPFMPLTPSGAVSNLSNPSDRVTGGNEKVTANSKDVSAFDKK